MERKKIFIEIFFQTLMAGIITALVVLVIVGVSDNSSTLEVITEALRFAGFGGLLYLILYRLPLAALRWRWKVYKRSKSRTNAIRIADRFISNPTAMFGTMVLVYACILFAGAHYVAPDTSPYAAQQVNELPFVAPGYTAQLFKVPVDRELSGVSWWQHLISGKQEDYRPIAVQSLRADTSGVYVERFFGEGLPGLDIFFSWKDLKVDRPVNTAAAEALAEKFVFSRTYYLGTDDLGRDYLSRMIVGIRVSLAVGAIAVMIALIIGVPVGAAAGFYKLHPPVVQIGKRRWKLPADSWIMWAMSVLWAIPTLLLVFPIVFAFGQQYYTIFIAVGITMWVDIARIVRGQVMQVREMEYIEATRSFGFSNSRTIIRHILPNITGPLIVVTAANFAYAILTEAGLSFLGIGIQPPAPSWGLMISKYKDNLITDPHLALIPGFAITLLVLAFFLLGNGLRDAFDIRMEANS